MATSSTGGAPGLTPLPIDAVVPEIVAAAEAEGAVVVEAPPGAGKTTRVPPALLAARLPATGEIWVLEPRRLPARLAAARVAAELGEKVGDTVGYSVRFEDVGGPRTRLRFLTEGLFLRRLLGDPRLSGVAAVVLDELHERHVATDLALAWLRRLREGARPDLAVVAMSATLAAEPVRAFLAGERRRATTVRSEGRMFEVAIEHLSVAEAAQERPLERRVSAAVRQVLREERDGDVLVFLPGAGEIRRAQTALAELPQAGELAILPLHGEMPLEEQTRAVRPAGRRKVVLATNVAESSITIDGIVAVVDAGLARVAAHSPWTGLPTLALAKVSRAAAEQRAGRAGRTRPGRALRLYTQHDFDQRPAFEVPELARADLADTVMTLAALGVSDPDALAWLEPPPAAAWGAARELLGRLGALTDGGALTDVGRRMVRFPAHPRLARLVVEGEARGAGEAAALAAALISERDIRAGARASFGAGGAGPVDRGADLGDLVDLYRDAQRDGAGGRRSDALRRLELDPRAVEEVGRARRQLASGLARGGARSAPGAEADALRLAVLTAFPDRVARRREPGGKTALLAGGGSAELGLEQTGDWLVAIDVEDRRGGRGGAGGMSARVPALRLTSRIEPEWLLDLFPERIAEIDRRAFDPRTERVERASGLEFGALALDVRTEPAPADDETARLLAEAALARGLERLPGGDEIPALLRRVSFARQAAPEAPLPTLGQDAVADLVRLACVGRTSFAELGTPGADLGAAVLAALPPEARRALDTLAPTHLTLSGGRRVPIHYDDAAPPWIESRLQDFFGTRAAPAIGGGRVPLTVHLLAPNGRAVQVTRDLAGFWTQHYPALRRELGRRYPKHAWPEDGATARPPAPPPPRRR
ncbi:MAG TPA: ATP-dependent helicase HrpB [Polyangia bacterium]|nr:ATP-dependent helicase HrpB [Polyangia bacterium]